MKPRPTQPSLPEPTPVGAAYEQIQRLLFRSTIDIEFRSRLLTAPNETLSEFLGRPMPGDFRVAFVENQADATIVLPDPLRRDETGGDEIANVSGSTPPLLPVHPVLLAWIMAR